jgi:hypothetical protein
MPNIEENTNIDSEEQTTAPDVSPPFPEENEEPAEATTRLVKIRFRPAGRHYDFATGKLPLTKGERVAGFEDTRPFAARRRTLRS